MLRKQFFNPLEDFSDQLQKENHALLAGIGDNNNQGATEATNPMLDVPQGNGSLSEEDKMAKRAARRGRRGSTTGRDSVIMSR